MLSLVPRLVEAHILQFARRCGMYEKIAHEDVKAMLEEEGKKRKRNKKQKNKKPNYLHRVDGNANGAERDEEKHA